MKAAQIELGQFYRSTQSNKVCMIFIFGLEDHYYMQGVTSTICEKWIYWDVSKRTIDYFTYLEEFFIDGLSLLESPIAQRNMKNCIRDNAEEDNEKIENWLKQKDEMLLEFTRNTVLPEINR